MNTAQAGFRLLAFTLVAVLALTVAIPTPAEALDPWTILAISSLVIAGVIIIVYLIVANVRGSRGAAESEPRYLACVESDTAPRACWAAAGPGGEAVAPAPAPVAEIVQGQ